MAAGGMGMGGMTVGVSPTGGSNTSWYFSKNGAPLVLLKHNNWLSFSKGKRKDDFYEMIKDNTIVADKFLAEESFSFQKIRELVQLYNFDAAKSQE